MAIAGLNQLALDDILTEHLTPSKEIVQPDRLFGRDGHLLQIERAFKSDGRNVFIFGDRGIGKTSVARTAATVNSLPDEQHIYVLCGQNSSFGDVMQSIGNRVVPLAKRLKPRRVAGGLKFGYAGASIGGDLSSEPLVGIPKPTNVMEALDILAFVAQQRKGRTVVVVDEFDRMSSEIDKILFAELIKNLPTQDINLRFIFCGIGHTVDEILGAHPSAGRYFEPIHLERIHHNFLWDIIKAVSQKTNVEVPYNMLMRIGIVSDGFPHFVHLIGQCLFHAINDDADMVRICARKHYEIGIKAALGKTEPTLRLAYQKATEKTKNRLEYEEALWALADRAETRSQMDSIYKHSYLRIIQQRSRGRKVLTQTTLNHRLLTLRKESHGKVVVGYGSGYFSLRENVLRGYIRLKAETEGIELIPDPV